MPGFSSYTARKILDHVTGKTAMGALPTAYIALFTVAGIDDGTGFTEVAGSSYARVTTSGATWNAATGTGPSYSTNAAGITFPAPSGSWGTVLAFGLYDDPTAGNLMDWDYLGPGLWLPVTLSSASPGVWTVPAHGYAASDSVVYTTEYGGTAPGLVGGSGALSGTLTVQAASLVTDSFNVKNGSTAVNTNTPGDGMVRKITPIAIGISSGAMSFAAGQLTLYCT